MTIVYTIFKEFMKALRVVFNNPDIVIIFIYNL